MFRCGDLLHQRVLRRHDHEGRAPQRIRSGGENFDGVARFRFKGHRSAFTASDPICLRNLDELGPVNAVKAQQFIGVFRRLEEPLFQFLFDHRRTAAVTQTVISLDLFTRQRRIARRTPIHRLHFTIRQPVFVQLDEEPFRPFVIFGVA